MGKLNRVEMVFGLLLAVRSGQQLINAPATMCPMYSDRAAGICGQITDIPTPKTSASPGVCLRGIGGPCTFVATSQGVSTSFDNTHTSADTACSSFDPEFS